MAKLTLPLMSMTASGQFGRSIVFDKRGHARKYVIPANPQSTEQMDVRNRMTDIQKTLKWLGTNARADVKVALGYRWNSMIVKELTDNGAARWSALATAFTSFTSQQKSDWTAANDGSGFVGDAGLAFYATATALYDVCLRVFGDGVITQPTASNSATIGTEWAT
jgi:hypothetical protein